MTKWTRARLTVVLVAASQLAFVAGCSPHRVADEGEQEPAPLSLVAILANAASHHERHVRVIGVVALAYEGTVLYLHREDYDRRIATNAVWLDLAVPEAKALQDSLEGRYVVVEGFVDARARGFRSLYGASLRVKRIVALRDPITLQG